MVAQFIPIYPIVYLLTEAERSRGTRGIGYQISGGRRKDCSLRKRGGMRIYIWMDRKNQRERRTRGRRQNIIE